MYCLQDGDKDVGSVKVRARREIWTRFRNHEWQDHFVSSLPRRLSTGDRYSFINHLRKVSSA